MKKPLALAISAVILLLMLVVSGCTAKQESEGFAIYLTKDDIPVSQMPVLSHVDLADKPIISLDDIISYNRETHGIQLTPEAFDRVDELKVPTTGRSFVVCVDKAPIYWGAFWAGYSSQSFDGVTIWVSLSAQGGNIIKISLGYPSSSFFQGEDPRSNPIIMESLEKSGKLK